MYEIFIIRTNSDRKTYRSFIPAYAGDGIFSSSRSRSVAAGVICRSKFRQPSNRCAISEKNQCRKIKRCRITTYPEFLRNISIDINVNFTYEIVPSLTMISVFISRCRYINTCQISHGLRCTRAIIWPARLQS